MSDFASLISFISDPASSLTVLVDPLTAVCLRYPTFTLLATRATPPSILTVPVIAPRSVLLPQPLGPTIPHLSLGSTRKLIDLRMMHPAPVAIFRSVRRRLAPFVSPTVAPTLEVGASDVVDRRVVVVLAIHLGLHLGGHVGILAAWRVALGTDENGRVPRINPEKATRTSNAMFVLLP